MASYDHNDIQCFVCGARVRWCAVSVRPVNGSSVAAVVTSIVDTTAATTD